MNLPLTRLFMRWRTNLNTTIDNFYVEFVNRFYRSRSNDEKREFDERYIIYYGGLDSNNRIGKDNICDNK